MLYSTACPCPANTGLVCLSGYKISIKSPAGTTTDTRCIIELDYSTLGRVMRRRSNAGLMSIDGHNAVRTTDTLLMGDLPLLQARAIS